MHVAHQISNTQNLGNLKHICSFLIGEKVVTLNEKCVYLMLRSCIGCDYIDADHEDMLKTVPVLGTSSICPISFPLTHLKIPPDHTNYPKIMKICICEIIL